MDQRQYSNTNSKKMMVIAPHPDDEMNLAAQLIVSLQEPMETYVVYTTNGDCDSKTGNKRIQEAINALSVIGVDEDHAIFLGYANNNKKGGHIFDSGDVVTSALGKTRTNALATHPEYCYTRHGVHHDFTFENFKGDLKSVIEEFLPDILICVDFDGHPDHRAASLTFDLVMGEILKERYQYRPLILKKFAYNGVWTGATDYYNAPPRPTLKEKDIYYSGATHALGSPAYTWEERISLRAATRTLTPSLRDNILYKMALQHTSTTAWYKVQRVLNADITYWHRSVHNQMFDATITASSGNTNYLNDFVLYGYHSIKDSDEPFEGASNMWRPDEEDKTREILVRFDGGAKNIRYINIYEDCSTINHIKRLRIVINETTIRDMECNSDGTASRIDLESDIQINSIRFIVEECLGQPGIAEIELLPEMAMHMELPLERYTGEEQNGQRLSPGIRVEQILTEIHWVFAYAIRYVSTKLSAG